MRRVALGAIDPRAGEHDGLRAGSLLTLQAAAAIDDVPSFVRSGARTGRLSGTVTCAAIGAQGSACDGTFQLFVPARSPA